MTELIKYDEARRMLAAAAAVDEVQDIRNKAEAMRVYARQAKDRDLEINAAQIRFRAERRLGELIVAQKETVGLNRGRAGAGRPALGDSEAEAPKLDDRPTLREAGIDPKLSSRAQRMAAIPVEKFEALLELHRAEVLEGNNKVSFDLMRTSAEADGRDKRRQLAQALSEATVALPSGRKYPAVYIDPPWHRKQGVTNRSYENHYATMSWSQICALPVAELLLPDAWIFIWIPRAHLLAGHEIETEVTTLPDGERVLALVEMPLAWAVAKSFGADSYSTCFVWTKTDEQFPDDVGGGLIVRDQDELLLLFKRGRGLPKPGNAEKFGSNHRERAREHSRKPEFYRQMIATMTGGLPVLEMFARVDAEHPLPAGWDGWGNQAAPLETCPQCEIDAAEANPGNDFAEEPSGESVTVAAADSASLDAAAVTDLSEPAAFPPHEFAELVAIAERQPGYEKLISFYIARGQAFDLAPGYGSLTSAGHIRLKVLERERAATAALFVRHLAADDFAEWQQLAAIAGGEIIAGEQLRSLVGLGLADLTTTRIFLTKPGKLRLAELEAIVASAEPPLAQPSKPQQLDLVELLEAAK